MALDTAASAQVLDLLFDEDNGVLSREYDLTEKNKVETLSFNDLDLLSGNLLDLMQPDSTSEDVFDSLNFQQTQDDPPPKKHKIHTDHDYSAHLSPGQHSDSGVSMNSWETDDIFLPNMAATDDHRLTDIQSQLHGSSPHNSESMSPLSDTNSDSNPLGLEDFDFSTCMDFGEGTNFGLDTINSSALHELKDTDVSIDFDFGKSIEPSGHSIQQHVQTIKTANGPQAIILVDAATRQPIKIQNMVVTSRNSDSNSLPFTMKDVDTDLSCSTDCGKFPDLRLTDEEKELLAREGVTLPANMPLTKEEERILKSVRRKIRNKVSAKESRKRKQGYVDGLELRVKKCTQENQQLLKKVDNLTKENTTLMMQLNKLKTIVAGSSKGHAQASTCVMVLLLSFALLVIPNISPFGAENSLSSEGGVRGHSRSLLGKEDQQTAKVSLFSEKDSQDSDPYGVSSKPGMPWESLVSNTAKEAPSEYSSVVKAVGDTTEWEEGVQRDQSVVNMEINETEEIAVGKGDHSVDAFQAEVHFESEAGSDKLHPPPAKKIRQTSDQGDDV